MTSAEAKVLIPVFLDIAKTLDGDEKSKAQVFLDHLFRALGHEEAKLARPASCLARPRRLLARPGKTTFHAPEANGRAHHGSTSRVRRSLMRSVVAEAFSASFAMPLRFLSHASWSSCKAMWCF